MDWYFSHESDDLIVPKDQEASEMLCTKGRSPSPDWLQWGVPTFENFEPPRKYCVRATNLITKECNFDERRSCDKELSGHKGKGSSNLRVFEEFSADYNTGKLDYQLQNLYQSVNSLGSQERADAFFLYRNSVLEEDPPNMENLYRTMHVVLDPECSSVPYDDLLTEMLVDPWSISEDSSCMGGSKHLRAGDFPLSTDDSLDGWYRVEDDPPSCLVQADSKGIEGSPNIKAPVLRVLIPAELDTSDEADTTAGEEKSLEETVLQELECVMAQLNQQTRICFRDALYRLARSSKQQHAVNQSASAELVEDNEISSSMGHRERSRFEGQKCTESETNAIDRTIANLMFNRLNCCPSDISV